MADLESKQTQAVIISGNIRHSDGTGSPTEENLEKGTETLCSTVCCVASKMETRKKTHRVKTIIASVQFLGPARLARPHRCAQRS